MYWYVHTAALSWHSLSFLLSFIGTMMGFIADIFWNFLCSLKVENLNSCQPENFVCISMKDYRNANTENVYAETIVTTVSCNRHRFSIKTANMQKHETCLIGLAYLGIMTYWNRWIKSTNTDAAYSVVIAATLQMCSHTWQHSCNASLFFKTSSYCQILVWC